MMMLMIVKRSAVGVREVELLGQTSVTQNSIGASNLLSGGVQDGGMGDAGET